MTSLEFSAYVAIYPKRLNVWYSDASPYKILGVSIPTLTSPPSVKDISKYIENLTKISIPLSTGGTVKVPLLTKTKQTVTDTTSPTGTSTYYICTVPPTDIPQPTSPLIAGTAIFAPSITVGDFSNSPYNATQNSIEASRTSEIIMQSDRYKVGTLSNPSYTGPLNIDLLIINSASKASVQDSNYSDTGWTRGRYIGSTTNKNTYGATAAESGRVFQGAYYTKGITADQIKFQISGSQVVYEDYFYAGVGTTPGISKQNTGFTLTGSFGIPWTGGSGTSPSNYSTFETVLYYKYGNTFTYAPKPLQAGDLIYVNNIDGSSGTELIKVISSGNPIIYPTYVLYSMTVQRAYLAESMTPTYQILSADQNVPIQKATLSTIYKVAGNKLQPVEEGKLVVKESGAILALDPTGVIYKTL